MAEQQDLSQLAFDSLSCSVFVLNPEFIIQHLNESAEAMIQCSAKQVVGQPIFKFLNDIEPSAADQGLKTACQKAIQNDFPVSMYQLEVSLPHALQSRQINFSISPVGSGDLKKLLLEVVSVERTSVTKRAAEWKRSTTSIVRGLAHEIRNPLGGIRGAAQFSSTYSITTHNFSLIPDANLF